MGIKDNLYHNSIRIRFEENLKKELATKDRNKIKNYRTYLIKFKSSDLHKVLLSEGFSLFKTETNFADYGIDFPIYKKTFKDKQGTDITIIYTIFSLYIFVGSKDMKYNNFYDITLDEKEFKISALFHNKPKKVRELYSANYMGIYSNRYTLNTESVLKTLY